MVSELAGEGAVPPQLPTPASHAKLHVCLRRSIRRGSLLSRQYVNPPLDSKLDFFVDVGNNLAYATGEVIRNMSAVLFKPIQSSVSDDSWSRSMKNTSKVLVNVQFAGVNRNLWSRSAKCSSKVLVNRKSRSRFVKILSKVLISFSFAIFNRSRSVNSSRVLDRVDAMFAVFDRDSWSRSSESLSAALVPLCVVILVNITASKNGEGNMFDRFIEEEFSENDQLEGLEKSNFNADLNAGEQENDDDLFVDVSFRNSNGKEHGSDLFFGKLITTDLKRRFSESDAFGIGRFPRGRPPLESITAQFPSMLRLECNVQIGSLNRRVLLRLATDDEYKIDVFQNARACLRLRPACERLKKVLSANEFEQISIPIFERVKKPLEKAIAEAGLAVENIHSNEVIGPGSRVPAIIKILTEFFGKEPRHTMNASECVAKGCALQCATNGEKEFFASMVVDIVIAIENEDRLNMIGIKKVPGGTMRDSFLVNGVAFKKTFSCAGFEQQPKKFVNLLNIELELKSEKGLTFPCLFKALAFRNSTFIGQQLHALAIKSSLILDIFVGCNALDMYSKTGIRKLADKVFEEMPDRNIATWNTSELVFDSMDECNGVSWCSLLAVYEHNNLGEKALKVFLKAKEEGIKPTAFMVLSVLMLLLGWLHLSWEGQFMVAFVVKACIEECDRASYERPKRNLITWNTLVGGYAHHRHAHMALDLFEDMTRKTQDVVQICMQ